MMSSPSVLPADVVHDMIITEDFTRYMYFDTANDCKVRSM